MFGGKLFNKYYVEIRQADDPEQDENLYADIVWVENFYPHLADLVNEPDFVEVSYTKGLHKITIKSTVADLGTHVFSDPEPEYNERPYPNYDW